MTPPRWAEAHLALACATPPCHVPPRGASSPARIPSSSPMWARSFGAILSSSRMEISEISYNRTIPPLPATPSVGSAWVFSLALCPPESRPRCGSLSLEHGVASWPGWINEQNPDASPRPGLCLHKLAEAAWQTLPLPQGLAEQHSVSPTSYFVLFESSF